MLQNERHGDGYYICPCVVSPVQNKAIRKLGCPDGGKVGDQMPITYAQLFRVESDDRPIYINQLLTQELKKLLVILFHLRPDLASRICMLGWEKNVAEITPMLLDMSYSKSEEFGRISGIIKKILRYYPEVGCIYAGRIVKVAEFGIHVGFLPDIEGLVHRSQLLNSQEGWPKTYTRGSKMMVKILETDGRTGHFKLSEKAAHLDLGNGKKIELPELDNKVPIVDILLGWNPSSL